MFARQLVSRCPLASGDTGAQQGRYLFAERFLRVPVDGHKQDSGARCTGRADWTGKTGVTGWTGWTTEPRVTAQTQKAAPAAGSAPGHWSLTRNGGTG